MPLELALFTHEFEQEVQAALPPRWMQRIALAPLAWIGKWRGLDLGQANTRAARAQPTATAIEGCARSPLPITLAQTIAVVHARRSRHDSP